MSSSEVAICKYTATHTYNGTHGLASTLVIRVWVTLFSFSSSFVCSRFSTTCIISRKRNEQRSTPEASSVGRWWKRAYSCRGSAVEDPWVAQSQEGRLWVLSDPTRPPGAVIQPGFQTAWCLPCASPADLPCTLAGGLGRLPTG